MPARWNKLLLILPFLLLLCRHTNAQQIVPGRIVTAAGAPLPFVSIALFKDSSFLAAAVSADDGSFRIDGALAKGTTYRLQLTRTGYRPLDRSFRYSDTAALLTFVLQEETKTLADVRVSARAPLVTRRIDRYIVSVENSFLADGHTALEVLQKSPGIWVDAKGTLRIRGNQPVLVMINDVVQQLSGDELADYLRSLRSEDISRIEVIPNPPAEYEAAGSGGIIHIILKKGCKDGWNGSLNAQYRQQGNKPYATAGATVNYGSGKLNITGSYTPVKDLRSIRERADIESSNSYYHNNTARSENIFRSQYRLGITYDVSARQTLSVQTAITRTRYGLDFTANETSGGAGRLDTSLAYSTKQRLFDFFNATINYSWKLDTAGATLRVIADHTRNKKSEANDFDQRYTDATLDEHSRNTVPVSTTIYTAQADYTQPLRKKFLVRSGIKWASIRRDNGLLTEDYTNGFWQKDPLQTNHFIYTENGLMFYASGEATWGRTSMKAGLRGEQTFAHGVVDSPALQFRRSYFGLFPSLFFLRTFDAKKGSSISFSYARRLTRPALSDLNPARLSFSNYTALQGNPDLRPQYANNLSLTYSLSRNWSAEAYLIRTRNFIALSAKRTGNVIDYRSENVGSTTEYGLSFSGTLRIGSAWTITNNAAAYASSYYYNDRRYRQASWYAKSVQTLAFRHELEMDVVADYRSPYVYTNLYTYGNFSLDAGLTKKFSGNKFRIRLALSDIFNSLRERELTEEAGTRIYFYRKRPTRSAALSFSWSFSKGKAPAAKRIDQGSTEERNRM